MLVESLVLAQHGGADRQYAFRSVFVPELLGPLHPVVDLLDQRLDPRTAHRQTRLPVLGVLHPLHVVPQVTTRTTQHHTHVRFLRALRCLTDPLLLSVHLHEGLRHATPPATSHPAPVPIPLFLIATPARTRRLPHVTQHVNEVHHRHVLREPTRLDRPVVRLTVAHERATTRRPEVPRLRFRADQPTE